METQQPAPAFTGLHFFVRDMAKTAAFYRLLGLAIEDNPHFVRVSLPNGVALAFGSYDLSRGYDPGFQASTGGAMALQFDLPSREAVEAMYAGLMGAGHAGHLAPFDAFCGSRYAEIEDPDGNIVGFHSPADDARRSAPPSVFDTA